MLDIHVTNGYMVRNPDTETRWSNSLTIWQILTHPSEPQLGQDGSTHLSETKIKSKKDFLPNKHKALDSIPKPKTNQPTNKKPSWLILLPLLPGAELRVDLHLDVNEARGKEAQLLRLDCLLSLCWGAMGKLSVATLP